MSSHESIAVCPLTRSPLRREGDVMVAEQGGLRYPIRDGVPNLLLSEATLPDGVASLAELCEKLGLDASIVADVPRPSHSPVDPSADPPTDPDDIAKEETPSE